jgi:hypothetical protein
MAVVIAAEVDLLEVGRIVELVLAVDVDRDARVARRLHAEHAHRLQIGTSIAGGVDATRAKAIPHICGGETESGAEHRAARQLI